MSPEADRLTTLLGADPPPSDEETERLTEALFAELDRLSPPRAGETNRERVTRRAIALWGRP